MLELFELRKGLTIPWEMFHLLRNTWFWILWVNRRHLPRIKKVIKEITQQGIRARCGNFRIFCEINIGIFEVLWFHVKYDWWLNYIHMYVIFTLCTYYLESAPNLLSSFPPFALCKLSIAVNFFSQFTNLRKMSKNKKLFNWDVVLFLLIILILDPMILAKICSKMPLSYLQNQNKIKRVTLLKVSETITQCLVFTASFYSLSQFFAI